MRQNGRLLLFVVLAVLCLTLALPEQALARSERPGAPPRPPGTGDRTPPPQNGIVYSREKPVYLIHEGRVYGADKPAKPLYDIRMEQPKKRNVTDPTF